MIQRFRNPAVEILCPSDASPSTTVSQRLHDIQRGRRIREKTSHHARLLPSVNKRDPTAMAPELEASDATRGVLDLLNRGFLPANVDLTPAFRTGSGSGVLKNGRTRLYDRRESPARPTPFSQPSSFNVASLKFDLTTSPASATKPVAESPGTSLPRLQSPPEEDKRQIMANRVVLAFQGMSTASDGRIKSGRTNQELEQPQTDESGLLLSMDDGGGPSNAMEELGANVDKIRGYTAMLDTFSLHQFVIHRGRVARSAPEFAAFQRSAGCADVWGGVEHVVRALEELLSVYFVPLAHVDGSQVLNLARTGQSSFSRTELLNCVLNRDQVATLLARPGQRFKGKDRRKRAAKVLQSALRMFARRRAFRRQCMQTQSAIAIQRRWRVWLATAKLKVRLDEWRAEREDRWAERMLWLRTNWASMSSSSRVIVHVPSLSGLTATSRLSIANFGARQNLQLSRVAALATMASNVDIVYVSPFDLPADVAGYSIRMLELAGVADASKRVRFVSPEQATRLPEHFSLASLVLYSPKCLSRIRRATRGKNAYIVAGHPGDDDVRLAQALDLPLLGWTRALPLITRSGAKRAFLRADVNVPLGAVDLFDEHEVAAALAKLLVAHLDFLGTWVLQLDVDPLGVGMARVDLAQLNSVRDLKRENRGADYWRQPGVRDAAVRQVLAEIEKKSLGKVVTLVHRDVFPSWKDFAYAMRDTGIVIEAEAPHVAGRIRANLFIEPGGDVVHVTSTHDILVSSNGLGVGYAFPQSVAPPEAVEGAATAAVRSVAREHGLWGHASVDLVLFRDERAGGASRLWATALLPFLTDAAASLAVFRLLTHAAARRSPPSAFVSASSSPSATAVSTAGDLLLAEARARASASASASASTPAVERCYVVADHVRHPGVVSSPYAALFHACRLHGVCLDVQRALGSVFLLTDSLAAGVLGLLSVSESRAGALAFLRTALEALQREAGAAAPSSAADTGDAQDVGNFAAVLATVRALAGGDGARLGRRRAPR